MSARHGERGFSLIEMMVVVLIIAIVSAMAIFALQPALRSAKADTAMRQVLDQMRQAREYSIANRRYVQVTFPTVGGQQNEIQMTELNAVPFGPGGANTVLSTVTIQPPSTIYVFPHTPDTPDGYGNAANIVFEGTNGGPPGGMAFQSDGTLVDMASFQPINGTVFLGVVGQLTSSRAVTVLGSTGRVRGWTGTGTIWFQF
jgi:prepilin-type N-terminal cleavage/methylation domain-containing protein